MTIWKKQAHTQPLTAFLGSSSGFCGGCTTLLYCNHFWGPVLCLLYRASTLLVVWKPENTVVTVGDINLPLLFNNFTWFTFSLHNCLVKLFIIWDCISFSVIILIILFYFFFFVDSHIDCITKNRTISSHGTLTKGSAKSTADYKVWQHSNCQTHCLTGQIYYMVG